MSDSGMILNEDMKNASADVMMRVITLTEHINGIKEDIKEVYAEAKDLGLDVNGIKEAVKRYFLEQKKPGAFDHKVSVCDTYYQILQDKMNKG